MLSSSSSSVNTASSALQYRARPVVSAVPQDSAYPAATAHVHPGFTVRPARTTTARLRAATAACTVRRVRRRHCQWGSATSPLVVPHPRCKPANPCVPRARFVSTGHRSESCLSALAHHPPGCSFCSRARLAELILQPVQCGCRACVLCMGGSDLTVDVSPCCCACRFPVRSVVTERCLQRHRPCAPACVTTATSALQVARRQWVCPAKPATTAQGE